MTEELKWYRLSMSVGVMGDTPVEDVATALTTAISQALSSLQVANVQLETANTDGDWHRINKWFRRET